MAEIIEERVNPKGAGDERFSSRWWAQPKDEIHRHLFQVVRDINTRQNYRTLENIRHARLYSDLDIVGFYSGLYASTLKEQVAPNRLTLNVIKSCIDTLTAKIAKQKPRPLFLTEGGNWKLQQRAKQLTKFMDGQFDAMGHYETKQQTFRDSCIFGTGVSKFYIDRARKKLCSERVIPEEIITDDTESIYGKPQNLYQHRLVNKDVLTQYYPKYAAEIEAASHDVKNANSNSIKDLAKVIEAWHLPSGPNANDGLHVICIDTATPFIEKWSFDWFPFTMDRWSDPITGFFGVGVARELIGIQLEINKILRNIQQSIHLFAIPRVFVSNSASINLAAINNDIGAIVRHAAGDAPNFFTPQAMSPDVYQHLWNLVQKAYEIVGVSQLSAGSKKPEGLDSGRALREFQDIESDRFQIVHQRRERGFIDDAKIVIELAKVLAKEDPSFSVQVEVDGEMKEIKWKDVELKESQYILRCFPASLFPTQPAAKMQSVIEYTQSGFLDKETAMDLMDFPDLQAVQSKMISPRRVTFKILDRMVETGKYEAPEPFLNLAVAKPFAQLYYLDARNKGVPEDRLELLRTFITDCSTIEQAAQAAIMQQQAQAAAAMAPIAEPQAPPTSDMLPINQ